MQRMINVVNACENNLKGINVSIPHGKICGVCGVSGSGKSTLACEVIAKYALNSFALGTPSSIQRSISDGITPKVDEVRDIPPVIYIDIKTANRSIRSTVATASGLMSILRNMFSACGKNDQEISGVRVYPRLFSYNISMVEGGGACGRCAGTGFSDSIAEEMIVTHPEKSLFSGAMDVVNEKGIKNTKITDLFLKAFCKEYDIDVEKKLNQYTTEETKLLFYGTDQIINFTDRSGTNGGKKSLAFKGIIGELLDVYCRTKNASIEKIVSKGECCACRGTRYNTLALSYKIDGYSIADILEMNVSDAKKVINQFANRYGTSIEGFAKEFSCIAQELENIGVAYLGLNRGVATLSGGELQRIKLARQIAMNLEGYCYVLDEPSTGLHNANIVALYSSLVRLKNNGNTVLLVEHSPLILKMCDFLFELGPFGGSKGGEVIAVGTPEEIMDGNSLTGLMLKRTAKIQPTGNHSGEKWIHLRRVTCNNLKGVDLEVPLNEFVTVVGVSGSGKSSAVNNAIFEAATEYIDSGRRLYDFASDDKLASIIRLDQNASVTNSRSSVCTFLGLMEKLKEIYVYQAERLKLDIAKAAFSKNSTTGACPVCSGRGVIIDEDQYEETCTACDGTGYKDEVLEVKYKGYNISELMSLTFDELIEVIDDAEINQMVSNCIDIGLGYLSLNRRSTTLSKGEYQRLRIAAEITQKKIGNNVYILDEPTKGLHYSDVSKVVDVLRRLVKEGNSVIAIEHNIDVILQSDYTIEFGPGAGNDGGKIIYCGEPSGLCKVSTPTANAINIQIGTTVDKHLHSQTQDIYVPTLNGDFIQLKKNEINVIQGKIGSGKSRLLKDIMFANSLKKYMNCVSNQGKYLTRDILAIPFEGAKWPLTRLVSGGEEYFGKDERVIETLNLSSIVEKIFTRANNCDKNINSSCYNAKKRAGKCPVCQGKGRFLSYDFEMIFSDERLESSLINLLNNRSRIDRISPLLKRDYGVCISGKYSNLSEEDRWIYKYGDRKKTVFYAPKKKEYVWEGCNSFIYSNISYADEYFREKVKPTWEKRICPLCGQIGVTTEAARVEYLNMQFGKFVKCNIDELLLKLRDLDGKSNEEKRLVSTLETLVSYGLGDISLYDYVVDLPKVSRCILQFLSYKAALLTNTILAWDDFSAIGDDTIKSRIICSLNEMIAKGITVLLVDNSFSNNDAHYIHLSEQESSKNDSCIGDIVIESADGDKYCAIGETKNGATIASEIGIVTFIRDLFKKQYKKYSFTGVKDEEKCSKCKGKSYYEVNMGDIGYCRCDCPDCHGTGFSEAINACVIGQHSIGEVYKMTVLECIQWLTEIGMKRNAEEVKIFSDFGLGNVCITRKYCDLSTNEKSLFDSVLEIRRNSSLLLSQDFLCTASYAERQAILKKMMDLIISGKVNINLKYGGQ